MSPYEQVEKLLRCPINDVLSIFEYLSVMILFNADICLQLVFRVNLGFRIFGLIRKKLLRKLFRKGIAW